jgi:hypothetical protein
MKRRWAKTSHILNQKFEFGETPHYYRHVKRLNVRISDSLFAEIATAAPSRNVSKSQIVRERLAAQSGHRISLWSRMEDLVFDGASLPLDLSSNKAHFDGYGGGRPDSIPKQ